MLLITYEFLVCCGDFDTRHFGLEDSLVGAYAKTTKNLHPKEVTLFSQSKVMSFHLFPSFYDERGSEESLPCAKLYTDLRLLFVRLFPY